MRIFMFLTLIVLSSATAQAAESEWVGADHIQAKLMASGDKAALQLRMTEGWHTYWRVAGDAGLPPRFDWTGSQNIKNVDVSFPAPKRKKELDFYTFGYDDEVTFPLDLEFESVGVETVLALNADVMVCKDICIPQNLSLSLPLDETRAAGVEKRIELARRKVPAKGNTAQLKIDTVVAGPEGLVLSVFSGKGFKKFDVFADIDGLGLTTLPEIKTDESETRKAMVKIAPPYGIENLNDYLIGKTLSITVVAGKEAVEKIMNF